MISRLLHAEPAAFIALFSAVVTFAVSAGVISQAHADTLVSIGGTLIPPLLILVTGLITRQNVYSPKTVQKIATRAASTGVASVPGPP